MNLFPLFTGISTSLIHVISGPDHLAAVTPIIIESKRKAWKIGLFWGVGHILGMLSIGGLYMVFKDFIPIDDISGSSEKLVGYILILIGIWAFYRVFFGEGHHHHPHIHHDEHPFVHIHKHNHKNSIKKDIVLFKMDSHGHHSHHHPETINQKMIGSLGIGFIHGLAGIAHFILFLPVLGFSTGFESILYIIGFGIGTIIAMVVYAFILGKITSIRGHDHDNKLLKIFRIIGGSFAIIIGVYWIL